MTLVECTFQQVCSSKLTSPGMCHFSMNISHANALASCAMNALGMCRSSMNILPTWITECAASEGTILSFCRHWRATLHVSEATSRLLSRATRWRSMSKKKRFSAAALDGAKCERGIPLQSHLVHNSFRRWQYVGWLD